MDTKKKITLKIELFNFKLLNKNKKFHQFLTNYNSDLLIIDCFKNTKLKYDDTPQNYFEWLSNEPEFLDMKYKYLLELEDKKQINKILDCQNNITFEIIKDILFNFFKNETIINKNNINKKLNVPFLSKELYQDNNKNVVLVKSTTEDKQFIKKIINENHKKVILVKSTTGTGKTTSFLNYIKEEKKPFIFISSRVSLACDFYDKVKSFNIPVKIYNDKILLNKIENTESNLFYYNDNIICQYDSIHKLENILEGTKDSEYIIYLDEINSLLNYICSSSTLIKKRSSCFYYFLNMLKMSKKIICTDNEITDITTSFFNKFTKKYELPEPYIIWNDYKTWTDKPVMIYQNEEHFKNIISEKIKNNTKINIISDSKSIIDIYKADLEDSEKPWTIQTSDEEYIKVSDWGNTTAYSPKITIGIDDQTPKEIFLIVQGRSVDCVDLFQMVCRARKLKYLHVFFLVKENKYHMAKFNTINDVDVEIQEKKNIYNEILTSYNVIYYQNDKKFYNYDDSLFYTIYREHLYINDMYKTGICKHFINILEREKFNIIHNSTNDEINKKITCKNTETKKIIKAEKLDNFNETDDNVIKLNKILKLSSEGIQANKELFVDKYLLNKHFNTCILFYKNEINLGVLDSNKNEFDFLKCTENRTKIHLLNVIQDYLGLRSVFDIKNFNQLNHNKINIDDIKNQYLAIYGKSKKINNCDSVKKLFDIYIANLKNLCGDVVKSVKKRNGSKLYYYHKIDENKLNYHFQLLTQRNTKFQNFKNEFVDDLFID